MKRTPIFRKILIPLMVLVIVEIFILVSTLFGQGLVSELRANEEDVLKGRVVARKNYLESVMVNDWMNLSGTVAHVTQAAEKLLAEGKISLAELDDKSGNCAALLTDAAPFLIEVLRTNHVTGAYIIINTDDLTGTLESGAMEDKPGIYLRDPDPTSIASERNEDIVIELSPREVVQNLRIATDVDWDVCFRFSGEKKDFYKYLYHPFQEACRSKGRDSSWQDMGYWAAPDGLSVDNGARLSYSVPLILGDGSVIGVLGTELSQSYLRSLFPHEELNEDGLGGYFLAQYHEDTGEFSHVFGFGNVDGLIPGKNGRFTVDSKAHYLYFAPLRIYNSNTSFSNQKWVLVGMLPHQAMQSFIRSLIFATGVAVASSLVIGLLACFLITYMLQRPVARLAQEMRTEDPGSAVQLSPTGILEIDEMSDEVMRLSRDVLESGRKFSKIIEMASVHLAGYEIDREQNTLFLTENFFSIFGRSDIRQQGMTVEEFQQIMDQYNAYLSRSEQGLNGHILRIPVNGKQRFIQVRILESGQHTYGLAEDVTQSLLEKQIIKYERDHDSLTNLYNRRAFRRKVQALFDVTANRISIGALVMIDLDNLKYINDNYGHEYGDRYIKQAAQAIEHAIVQNVCHARISGDEFNVFIYGYGGRSEIEEKILKLRHAMSEASITLPDGATQRLRATSGVAWYPQDSTSFDDLSKYADYAMYRAKQENKGDIQNFDMDMFQKQDIQLRNSAALTRMIEEEKLYYAFQPIVDVRTGNIFAYEALMRPDVGMYFNVKDAVDTARREGKLSQIEELTWTVGLRNFDALVKAGKISADSCLFINSIPTQRLSEEKEQELLTCYGHYGARLVMELTEDERMDAGIWHEKELRHKAMGGCIALDDYGAGYNSEKALLTLSPDLIKVDLDIVRDIHLDADKRAIVEYIVNYAHTRGKKVIAEGVETADETRTIVRLGVDYIQGYFFAKPLREPNGVSEKAVAVLKDLAREYRG